MGTFLAWILGIAAGWVLAGLGITWAFHRLAQHRDRTIAAALDHDDPWDHDLKQLIDDASA